MLLNLTSEKAGDDRRLMLFDLSLGGHHGNYIQHLIDYWCNKDLSGSLEIVVPPEFLRVHQDVVSTLNRYHHPAIHLSPITETEVSRLAPRSSRFGRIRRNFQEWRLYQKYASLHQVTHSLLMYFDTCELPLAAGLSSPCPFSGIYFRPTFHYPYLTHSQPSRQEQRQQAREKFTLSLILRHPQLKTLFCLDPFVVKHLDQFRTQAGIVPLVDPVVLQTCSEAQVEQLRKQLGVEPGKTVFLLFGALEERKGIYQLLDAIALLPPEYCQSLCLLVVGATNQAEKALIQPKIAALSQALPVQIIEHYEFVAEADVNTYFHLSDVVLAPYQKHVGMSGILLLAAAAATPVLSSDYGLMGEVVRRYGLGLTVDSTRPEAICKGLVQLLQRCSEALCDQNLMQSFAKQNSVELFASTIFQHLFSSAN